MMERNKKIKLASIILFNFIGLFVCSSSAASQDKLFLEQNIESWPLTTKKIVYQVQGQQVGFLHFLQVVPYIYIIHSFYIIPELRNQGYGTELLLHVCTAIKKEPSNKIFIQPGPFELDDLDMSESERALRLERLVKL